MKLTSLWYTFLIAAVSHNVEAQSSSSAESEDSASASSADSSAFECVGVISTASHPGAGEDIVVPENESCFILDVNVKKIDVKEGGTLKVGSNGSICPVIDGDVKCDKCTQVDIVGVPGTCNTVVQGSIEATQATRSVIIENVTVEDGIQVTKSILDGELSVEDNEILNGKDVLIKKSSAPVFTVSKNTGAKKILFNENPINGDLVCTD